MKSTDHIRLLEARIQVLAGKIVEQSHTYDMIQNKMFAIVGLLLTLGGLITYDVFRINAPDTLLETIVLLAALLTLGFTIATIGYSYRVKKDWSVPIGPVDEEKLNNSKTYETGLGLIHDDYLLTYRERGRSLDAKAKYLNNSLYAFIISVILLVVLKIGG